MSTNKTLRRLIIGLTVLFVIVFAWLHRYDIYDWSRLRNYDPPARIAELADDVSMNDYGRRLFYVNYPELNDKSEFNDNCTISEQSIVLGCYVGGQGIYIFDVSDERLSGVHQVTAVHEMLHAAYDRLSGRERARVDKMTADTFASLQNERLEKVVDAYHKRDPSVVANELHSILATEVRDLPDELEAYYKRYLNDRLVVVDYSERYEAAFSERLRQVEAYEAELESLRQEIDTLEASLTVQRQYLEAERARMDGLLANGQTKSYNAAVPDYNASIRSYNADVAEIQSMIDEFNEIVSARNAIALEENELLEAIDSRPSTLQTE